MKLFMSVHMIYVEDHQSDEYLANETKKMAEDFEKKYENKHNFQAASTFLISKMPLPKLLQLSDLVDKIVEVI